MEMDVSSQETVGARPTGRARQRARTRKAVLQAARQLMRRGLIPSVADAAETADVSRATAYRYFPSQSALVQAAIEEIMATVPTEFDERDPVDRVRAMARRVVRLAAREEPLLRAALLISLEQWAQQQAGEGLVEEKIRRGGRRASVASALAPAAGQADATTLTRLEAALAVLVGIEARVVLTDIYGLDDDQIEEVVQWASTALADAAFGRDA